MSTWTLVVVMWWGPATFSVSIPGFSTQARCFAQAKPTVTKIKQDHSGSIYDPTYMCVEVN